MKYIFLALSSAAVLVVLFSHDRSVVYDEEAVKRNMVFCSPSFDAELASQDNSPVLSGLGNLHFRITTSSDSAQLFFNQGLRLTYAFNHGEAARSFRTALRHDSKCAMAYWGLAMVLGPNYNVPLDPTSLDEINAITEKAVLYSANTTEREQLLAKAISKRFPKNRDDDPRPHYEEYALLMKDAWNRFPEDVNIGALYADALMNQHPWDLWLKDGMPQPWTPEILSTLEKTLARDPDHPGAIHFYIHATEASRNPGVATPFADRLRGAMPAAGHLVHMPSHTYIRTGEYHKGVLANEKASAADSTYIAQCRAQGFYPMYLYPHNLHFLAACAFFEGNSKKALNASWAVSRKANRELLQQNVTIQHFYSIPYFVMVHFGKWSDIINLPAPESGLKYPSAIWHYARGMAFANTNKRKEARNELDSLYAYAKDESLKTQMIWDMNSALDIIHIAALTLEAEILGINGEYDMAIAQLDKAIAIETALNYNEPPDWFFSVRHSKGHWLNEAGRFAEAEIVYNEDLVSFPENGWALKGLYNSLKGQDKLKEANKVAKRFGKAFKHADVRIETSRVR